MALAYLDNVKDPRGERGPAGSQDKPKPQP